MVLVVDDHADTRELMLVLLRTIRRSAVAVASGQAALDYLNAHDDVSCVILDFRMPELSGLDVLRAIRDSERLRHLCVLMYSADDGDTERLCLDAGANAFVHKASLDWLALKRTILAFCGESEDGHPDLASNVPKDDQRSAG